MGRVPVAALLGVGAGFFSGLFGIGGGLLMVPVLVLWLGLTQHRAHATSMAAIVVAAGAAVVPFAASQEVVWSTGAWLLVGSTAGAAFGAWVISRIPALWLARSFVLLALVAAARLGLFP